MSARAWDLDNAQRLRRSIEQAKDLVVYLIDVGVEAPRNTGVTSVRLSSEVLPENAGLSVRATFFCVGEGGRREIELHVEDLDPTLPLVSNDKLVVPPTRLRGHRVLELAAGAAEDVEFTLPELGLGTRHAEIRLAGTDALTADDACHFTVVVREAWLVLIVAPRGVDTAGFVEAIAPYEHRLENRSHYDCLVITPEEIPNRRLEDYAAVVLLDPTPLPAESWRQVGSYVRNGGQLAMFLGHHAESAGLQLARCRRAAAGKIGPPVPCCGSRRLSRSSRLRPSDPAQSSGPSRPPCPGIASRCSDTGASAISCRISRSSSDSATNSRLCWNARSTAETSSS